MKRFIIGFFASIGFLTFLFVLILGWGLYRLSSPTLPLMASKENLVLNLTLGDQNVLEEPHRNHFKGFMQGQGPSLHMLVEGISHATKDANVKGILLTLEGDGLHLATTQELRDALKTFKAAGKFIYTYSDTFGELSNATKCYYLAALSKIWVMPLGHLNFNGVIMEIPFAKKALEDLKIRVEVGRREEYKGSPESITESDFTPPYRENMQRLLDVVTTQIVKDVAEDRGLSEQEVRNVLNTSPISAKQAVSLKMIDEIGYKDEVKEAIKKQIGTKPNYYDFEAYANSVKDSATHGPKIALIYGVGKIAKSKTVQNPFSDEGGLDSGEVVKTIREAGEDNDIKAIVFRVDSGGGEPIASELIDREIERLKGKKPVIVSMANYAASGGYLISCNALKIVAQPGTLTGSIGVYAGKPVTQDFWEHYGVHWGEVHNGNNAAIWSTGHAFTSSDRQIFENYLDLVYSFFQDRVAKGRGLSPEKVHQIAKGEVWTGSEAKENGLVDELGGMNTAIQIAKKEAGIAADVNISLVHLPAQKSLFSLLFNRNKDKESQMLARYPALQMVLSKLDTFFGSPKVELITSVPKP